MSFHTDGHQADAEVDLAATEPSPTAPEFDELAARALELEQNARADATSSLLHLYEQGELVRELKAESRKYGKSAVKKLAERVGVTDKLLYMRADAVGAFPDSARFKVLVREINNDAQTPITMAHIAAVRKLATVDEREAMLRDAARNGHSAKALAAKAAAAATRRSVTVNRGAVREVGSGSCEAKVFTAANMLTAQAATVARLLDACEPGLASGTLDRLHALRHMVSGQLLAALDRHLGEIVDLDAVDEPRRK